MKKLVLFDSDLFLVKTQTVFDAVLSWKMLPSLAHKMEKLARGDALGHVPGGNESAAKWPLGILLRRTLPV